MRGATGGLWPLDTYTRYNTAVLLYVFLQVFPFISRPIYNRTVVLFGYHIYVSYDTGIVRLVGSGRTPCMTTRFALGTEGTW